MAETDLVTPLGLARMAYDSADYARERTECVALHLERHNRLLALKFLREAKRSAGAALAALTAIEASLENAAEVSP